MQFELTTAQYKFLAKMMPRDYVLEMVPKTKKELPSLPLSKKTSTAV